VDKAKWALYLPLVQRILNATPDSSIGTYPSRLLFGDQLQLQGPLLVEVEGRRDVVEVHDPQSYLFQISAAMKILVERSRVFLDVRNAEAVENAKKLQGTPVQFAVGDYVLIEYPSRPPHKLSAMYRGPMRIVQQVRDDIYTCYDMVSNTTVDFHIDRLRIFNTDSSVQESDLIRLAAKDKDEYLVESIVAYRGNIRGKRQQLEFRIHWQGYDDTEDTWLPWSEVRDLILMDAFIREHPELKFLNTKR